jgi:type III secretory pathway component EscV
LGLSLKAVKKKKKKITRKSQIFGSCYGFAMKYPQKGSCIEGLCPQLMDPMIEILLDHEGSAFIS